MIGVFWARRSSGLSAPAFTGSKPPYSAERCLPLCEPAISHAPAPITISARPTRIHGTRPGPVPDALALGGGPEAPRSDSNDIAGHLPRRAALALRVIFSQLRSTST